MVNISNMLSELKDERDRIIVAIQALEGLVPRPIPRSEVPPRPKSNGVAKSRATYARCQKCGADKPATISALCRRCGNTAAGKRKRQANDHGPKVHACGQCGEMFAVVQALTMHERSCDGRDLKEKRRKQARDWARKHSAEVRAARAAQPEVIKVHCPDCPDVFHSAQAMGIHRTRMHFGESSGMHSQLDGVNV